MAAKALILVVDDDPDFVEITRTVLEKDGFEVISAPNGSQGLARARREHPDLVILDVMMSSVLDGVNASQVMRDDPELNPIPLIMASSIAQSEHADQFPTDEYMHVDAWLAKPVQPQELLKQVNKLIR
jgi:two-component system, OmpR family, alkaline phosphatase synthesis response regulator PhoP